MASRQIPKYQAIYGDLRQKILSGELAPGERLAPQHEMAAEFGVTLMTLRQAVAALEADALVRVERGLGSFVSDRPVDIRFDNLSSFAAQMQAAGTDLATEVLSIANADASSLVATRLAIELGAPVTVVTRRRAVDGVAFALQRSFFGSGVLPADDVAGLGQASLYELFEAAAQLQLGEARESISAVALTGDDADLLGADEGEPALRSMRVSVTGTGQPFLFDDALLVGGRAVITADRTSDRLALRYGEPG